MVSQVSTRFVSVGHGAVGVLVYGSGVTLLYFESEQIIFICNDLTLK